MAYNVRKLTPGVASVHGENSRLAHTAMRAPSRHGIARICPFLEGEESAWRRAGIEIGAALLRWRARSSGASPVRVGEQRISVAPPTNSTRKRRVRQAARVASRRAETANTWLRLAAVVADAPAMVPWGATLARSASSGKKTRRTKARIAMADHRATVVVNAPIDQVYPMFTHFNDFPKFMSFVKEV